MTFWVCICTTMPIKLAFSTTYVTLPMSLNFLYYPGTDRPCSPDVTNVHVLFSITALTKSTSSSTTSSSRPFRLRSELVQLADLNSTLRRGPSLWAEYPSG